MSELKDIIKNFSVINDISEEAAAEIFNGVETAEEALAKIKEFTRKKIEEKMPTLNRAQRRALNKKKKQPANFMDTIKDTSKKLAYMDLIQKLRALNEKKAKENKDEEISQNN